MLYRDGSAKLPERATSVPTHEAVSIPNAQFRILLLRRLPLPLAPRTCSCRGRLDAFGDHRAACATSAVARVCREAGARVARNVRVADMNIDVPVAYDRRIEVVANGFVMLCPFGTARSSRLTRRSFPRSHVRASPGRSVTAAALRRLVVIGLEVGDAFGTEAATFLRFLARHRAATIPAPPTSGSGRLGGAKGGAPGRCGPARVRIFLARAAPCG